MTRSSSTPNYRVPKGASDAQGDEPLAGRASHSTSAAEHDRVVPPKDAPSTSNSPISRHLFEDRSSVPTESDTKYDTASENRSRGMRVSTFPARVCDSEEVSEMDISDAPVTTVRRNKKRPTQDDMVRSDSKRRIAVPASEQERKNVEDGLSRESTPWRRGPDPILPEERLLRTIQLTAKSAPSSRRHVGTNSAPPSSTKAGTQVKPTVRVIRRGSRQSLQSRVVHDSDLSDGDIPPGPRIAHTPQPSSSRKEVDLKPSQVGTPATNLSDGKYRTVRDTKGMLVSGCGALFPPGYEHYPDSRLPWICPIRSCRKIFANVIGVGSHFSLLHRDCRLNDNGDGTFSIVAVTRRQGKARRAAVVVSNNPLGPDEPPMAEPAQPGVVRGGHINPPQLPYRGNQSSLGRGKTQTPVADEGHPWQGQTSVSISLKAAEKSGPVLSTGTRSSGEMLMMEDWEVSPGTIRDESGQAPDNVAFSNAYLTLHTSIPVSSDIGFNVAVLKPGGGITLTEEDARTRICSVASGKVRVKMGDLEFLIGPNGMFKVKSKSSCTVYNRLYIDAILHVTTITEF